MKIAYLSIPVALLLLVSMIANVSAAPDFVEAANKDYYTGPKLDRLIIRYVTDNAVQWELFKTKEVNFVRAESIPETQLIDYAAEHPDVFLARVAPPPWGAGIFFQLENRGWFLFVSCVPHSIVFNVNSCCFANDSAGTISVVYTNLSNIAISLQYHIIPIIYP